MKRLRLTIFVITLVLSISLLAGLAPVAHAMGGDMECSGTGTVHFAPGITNTPQQVQVTATTAVASCLAPFEFTGGTSNTASQQTTSCTNLGFSSHETTYNWNDGATSVVDYATTVATRLADGSTQIEGEGSVISGLDSGDDAVQDLTLPELDIDACDSPTGLTSISGLVDITFLPL
jgi:hypothetical protein